MVVVVVVAAVVVVPQRRPAVPDAAVLDQMLPVRFRFEPEHFHFVGVHSIIAVGRMYYGWFHAVRRRRPEERVRKPNEMTGNCARGRTINKPRRYQNE